MGMVSKTTGLKSQPHGGELTQREDAAPGRWEGPALCPRSAAIGEPLPPRPGKCPEPPKKTATPPPFPQLEPRPFHMPPCLQPPEALRATLVPSCSTRCTERWRELRKVTQHRLAEQDWSPGVWPLVASQPRAWRSRLQGAVPSLPVPQPRPRTTHGETPRHPGGRKEADPGEHRFHSHKVQSQADASPSLESGGAGGCPGGWARSLS